MVISALRPDASLPEFLADRARSASLIRLSMDVAAGVVAAASAIWWKPDGWLVFTSAAVCFLAYGSWGLLDRVRSRPWIASTPIVSKLCEALSALAVLAGAIAAGSLLFSTLGIAMGIWTH